MSQHRIHGVLTRDAWVCRDRGGNYAVYVELTDTSEKRVPIVAKRDCGHDTPGAITANAAARHLRQGCRVYVHCVGIGLGATTRQEAAIRCCGVDHIELLDVNGRSALPKEASEIDHAA